MDPARNEWLTTDVGLMSLAVIVGMLVIPVIIRPTIAESPPR